MQFLASNDTILQKSIRIPFLGSFLTIFGHFYLKEINPAFEIQSCTKHYFFTVIMQKNTSIQQFNLDIQPILESQDLGDHVHFLTTSTKKIIIIIIFILIYSWYTLPKSTFYINFIFPSLCINLQKNLVISSFCSRVIVDLKILQTESILTHISGTRFFSDMGFVLEYSKQYKLSLQTKYRRN